MTRVMTAMVLGAGLGTRMRPLTDTIPKPLVALDGRPLIDHVLDRLHDAGIGEAVVNVHYLADRLESHLQGRASPEIIISDERAEILDTGGGVAKALPLISGDSFIVHNSDSVWMETGEPALDALLSRWDPSSMDSLLLLAPVGRSVGYSGRGDFDMDETGRISRRQEGTDSVYVFAGVSIAHRRIFSGCPQGPFSLNLLWDRAIKSERLYGVRLEGIWMHVGTPEAVSEAESVLKGETR